MHANTQINLHYNSAVKSSFKFIGSKSGHNGGTIGIDPSTKNRIRRNSKQGFMFGSNFRYY